MRRFTIIVSLPLLIAAARFVPLDRLPSTCVFYRVTGYPCPTCGMTRSLAALAHLDFGRALSFNPIAVILAAFFALLWSAAVHEILTRRRTRLLDWIRPRVPTLVLSCIGLTILYGVLRIVLG
ncbi:MAG: DUF2752 domain-containing protein [Armatimonadetes bacterium]|nr:DUF2752 domain-containing protein [Armatimonadota bacterium]